MHSTLRPPSWPRPGLTAANSTDIERRCFWGPRPGPPMSKEQGGPGPSSRAAPTTPQRSQRPCPPPPPLPDPATPPWPPGCPPCPGIPPGPSASSNDLTVPLPLRARGCQPQEPCFYRRCQEGPAPHHLSEADALRGRRGPSSCSGHPPLLQDTHPLLQDTHPPTHRSNRDAPASARTRPLPGRDELFSSTWWWDGEGGDPTRQAAST